MTGKLYYLRRMEEEDLPQVYSIESLSFPNPWKVETFRGEIQNWSISFPYVVVHALDKKVIGYIILWQIRDEVQINNIAIHPDFRQKRIGEGVLREVISKLQKERAKFISLEVRPSNAVAFHLYKKLGFELIGRRKDYYINPQEDALVLGLILNQ